MRGFPAIAAAGVMAIALAACGCSKSSPQSAGGQQFASGKTLTAVLSEDPGSLDPDFTSQSITNWFDTFLYDSLLNVGANGQSESGLASKWTGNTTTATFTLHKGITCSDGTSLTASDVAANINFVGNPKNASNKITVDVPPGATATADNTAGTVTVTSPTPSSFLVQNLGRLPIVCPKGMADRALLKEGADGTGPFTLTQALPGNQYTLTARKGYDWGPGNWQPDPKGFPAKVVFKVVSNVTTAANLLLTKSANLASVTGADEQRLEAKHLLERNVVSPLGELWFNQKPGLPTSDVAVRKALTEALDLPQLGQVDSSDEGVPITSLVASGFGSPCQGNTVSGNLPAHSVAAAEATLNAAGWKVGPGGIRVKNGKKLTMTVIYVSGAASEAAAELLQKDWNSIGVQVTLSGLSVTELSGVVFSAAGNWGASFIALGITLPSQLVAFFSGPTPPTGRNFAYVDNPTYDADVKAASALPGAGGCSEWNAAERSLIRQLDIVPFVDAGSPWFAQGATFAISDGAPAPTSIRMLS